MSRLIVVTLSLVLTASTFVSPTLRAQPPACPGVVYGRVCLPQGQISFADEVVSFVAAPRPAGALYGEPKSTLGTPDANGTEPTYLSLGCHGVLTLRFIDNALINIEGPDLYVFEIGPAVESTALAISADNLTWIEVGDVAGATTAVDIGTHVREGDTFQYVRLTNLSMDCGGVTPGADVDAVAAIGSAARIALDGAILFETGQANLKAEARRALDRLGRTIASAGPKVKVTIEGHTDDVGPDRDNQRLSEARARAVMAHLSRLGSFGSTPVTSLGYGESRPIRSNDSVEGRAQNRRVEILIQSN
jgi:OOP family OmpA-OmpF porin